MRPMRKREDDVQWQHKHGGGRSASPGKATKPPTAYKMTDPLIEDQGKPPQNRRVSVNTTSVGHTPLDCGDRGTAR